MTKDEIETRCRKIVSEHLDVTGFSREANFIDDLGADSLDGVEIVIAVEMEFDIEVPDAVAENCKTFGALVDAVAQALGVGADAGA